MNEDMKKMIIMENYQNPKNRGLIEDDSYKVINTNSESCIDQVDLQVKIENNIIKDIRFDGEACAICTSSTSIMINSLITFSSYSFSSIIFSKLVIIFLASSTFLFNNKFIIIF